MMMATATTVTSTRFFHLWSRSLSFASAIPHTQSATSTGCFEFKEQQQDEVKTDTTKLRLLKQKMDALGIISDESSTPGRYNPLFCPKCGGGHSLQRSLSFHISQDGNFALWRCFSSKCGWAGKIISYFRERKLSVETLRRNAIMQLSVFDQVSFFVILGSLFPEPFPSHWNILVRHLSDSSTIFSMSVIAFTYRQGGLLVGCKYRTMEKKFWQEKGTDKILYGVDDIKEEADIIIVEGEIDKLSLDEVGFHNCVSVPCGAPQIVSTKELPSLEKDTAFQYLWNGKEYLDKASRILLATDGDIPGQALAEELARRLGKDRCWRVCWPKKDEFNCYKDANEVLKSLGPAALREIIENAELYEVHVSKQL